MCCAYTCKCLIFAKKARRIMTAPDFWMNLQQRWDLFQAIQNEMEAIQRIQPVHAASPVNKQAGENASRPTAWPLRHEIMNCMRNILKPNALAGMLLLLILLVQGACFTSGSVTYSVERDHPDKTVTSYGAGSPITGTHFDGATSLEIKWPILLINLGVSYWLAAALAGAFARATRFRRPANAFAMFAFIMIVISFLAATGMSKYYWGYFFARPSVLAEISHVASVSAVIPITTEAEDDGSRRIVVQKEYSISDHIAYARKDPYYGLSQRLLLALDDVGLLPPSHAIELTDLPILFPLIQKTGILADPEEGYDESDFLSGIVVDTLDESGDRLVFVGVNGRQLSNDHYAYYEMVFTGKIGSQTLSHKRGQRFFYDVAGIEGAEWHLIWPLLAVAGVVTGFVVLTVFMPTWRLVRKRQEAQPSLSLFRRHRAGRKRT
jgi:hypothetical protein